MTKGTAIDVLRSANLGGPLREAADMGIEALRSDVWNDEMQYVNKYSLTPLSVNDVYMFTVRLCDNEIDRDYERFTIDTIETLGELFEGKSGVIDHKYNNNIARIYRTEVVIEPEKTTAAGDEYCWLKGYAYIVRTENNADIISEIEAGIKKEVSIGCSLERNTCSICGEDINACYHKKGEHYDGNLCYVNLKKPMEAYEWAFVSVPVPKEKNSCEWCESLEKKNRDFKLNDLMANATVQYTYYGDGKTYHKLAKYCPMCGRKLDE